MVREISAIVGQSNRTARVNSTAKMLRILDTTRVARREWPPSWKKLYADAVQTEEVGPDSGDELLGGGGWRDELAGQVGTGGVRGG